MFFCRSCARKLNWPNSIYKPYRYCGVCNKYAQCNDVPSKYLPEPKDQKPKLDIDSIT